MFKIRIIFCHGTFPVDPAVPVSWSRPGDAAPALTLCAGTRDERGGGEEDDLNIST